MALCTDLSSPCTIECGGCCYPLRATSWLIASFVLSEDAYARDELDRRFPVSEIDRMEIRDKGYVWPKRST